jgi:hypothetical protein
MQAEAPQIEVLTMSDLAFLPQTLVLHRSLLLHARSFRLRVLCMDEASERFLSHARLGGVDAVPLRSLEERDAELAALRHERSWREYCWTATPAFCRFALERASEGSRLLWVDSDVEFLGDPRALLAELGDGSILLTPHAYYRTYPKAASGPQLTQTYGRFNGGTIAFRADDEGRAAAELWRSRTVEWCGEEPEPGRYGNQRYLSDFPARFPRARILQVPAGGIGPWNSARYRIESSGSTVLADGRMLIFYHYQSLRLCRAPRLARLWFPSNIFRIQGTRDGLVARINPWYRLARAERRLLWRPYLRRLTSSLADVARLEPDVERRIEVLTFADIRKDARRRLGLAAERLGGAAFGADREDLRA